MQLKRTNSQILQKQSQQQKQSVKSTSEHNRKKVSLTFHRQLQANSKRIKQQQSGGIKDVFKSALRLFVCTICYSNVDTKDTYCFGDCGHYFCGNCLTQCSIYQIKVHEDVMCPQENCQVKLTQNNQFFQTLPQEYKDKFKQNALWKQTIDNPNIKLCQKTQCKGGLVDMLKDPPQCQKCHTKYCKQCMMAAHQGPCDQNFGDHFRQWKRCPKCKMFIQKQQGCNHMTCRCTHQFCYVCLTDWEPGHYQCVDGLQNRLFFSQAQSVPKVKAFFSLIGLVLLVPLLLIVLIALGLIGAVLACALGIILSPCVLAKQISGCGCCCPIFFFILLPFAIAIGAIASPIFFIVANYKPFAYRLMRQHLNSITFLAGQMQGPRRR